MDGLECAFFLSTRQGIGRKTLQRLTGFFGSVEAVCGASGDELRKVGGITEKCVERILDRGEREQSAERWRKMREDGIRYQSYFCGPYPEKLRNLFDYPIHIFIRGQLPDPARLSIAVVGARECSYYGRDMARMFGYRLAEAGVNVISGMARGVDGWAHQGALESGGSTVAVLGCGVDVCYPAEHQRLYESIAKRGGILSEYPPGVKAKPCFFPLRNRLISGLSDGILVVEAKERSGSLITADAALEQGKDVFVIPGRIGDELSVGCNRLIRQGAVPVLAPGDILEYYGIPGANEWENIPGIQNQLLEKISENPISIQQLQREMDASPVSVLRGLMSLQKKKKIREIYRGYFVKIP